MRLKFNALEEINHERLLCAFSPSSQAKKAPRQLNALDWDQLRNEIAARCVNPSVAAFARDLHARLDAKLLRRRILEVAEIMALNEEGDRIPIANVGDPLPLFERALRRAVLEAAQLKSLALITEVSHQIVDFFAVRQEDAPLTAAIAADMVDLPHVGNRIAVSILPNGEISDIASPNIAPLRRTVSQLAGQLRTLIEAKLTHPNVAPYLQDKYYTQRAGRYVLPIRANEQSRVAGIVHASSGTGQTVFIEPADLIELNNRLIVAQGEVDAEEYRILRELSEMIADNVDGLKINLRRIHYFDLLAGIAKLSNELACHVPDFSDGEIELYQAVHPLLRLRFQQQERSDSLVANDILLAKPHDCMVISGTNAGGKSVTLKMIGLFALMLKNGMPIPAGASSAFPIFDRVIVELGDAQSINHDNSTFTAHVKNIANATRQRCQNALFLLDEPFSGTDPAHAWTLGVALVNYLHPKGATTVMTTHFEAIKAYAIGCDWMVNAAMGFDNKKMRPTYRLVLGRPGTSSAFEIATQCSLAPAIIADARALYHSGDHNAQLESVLASLDEERAACAREREEIRREQAAMQLQKERFDEKRQALEKKEFHKLSQDIQKARDTIAKLKKRLKNARSQLYKKSAFNDAEKQREIGEELASVGKSLENAQQEMVAASRDINRKVDPATLAVGQQVYLKRTQSEAVVTEIRDQEATLQIGVMQVRCKLDELYQLPEDYDRREITSDKKASTPPSASKPKRKKTEKKRTHIPSTLMQSLDIPRRADEINTTLALLPENTLDLRGLDEEDAREQLRFFIPSAEMREVEAVAIIHGHGTGVLKRMVRQFLKKNEAVIFFRPGAYGEGGDGITLAVLRGN